MQGRSVELKVSAKLTGHFARSCFALLCNLVERQNSHVHLNLRECTSFDSIGLMIIEWAANRNGKGDVKVSLPVLSRYEKEMKPLQTIK
ncbi:MAG: hypothetical protein E3J72_21895 [Planctomycetota bacterium]|nr:MAG: hypothetical protein E3J72_21895 [Planctomycetota bacterium]